MNNFSPPSGEEGKTAGPARNGGRGRQKQDDLSLEIPGSDFFYSLVDRLARSVDVHCAWIAEAISAPEPTLRTLAVSIEGKDAGNFEYSITNTPARSLFSNSGICLIPTDVRERFPSDPVLRLQDARGYAGIPLLDSRGEVLGLLAVTSRNSLANTRQLASRMRICAHRATGELERRRSDAALRASEARMKLIFDNTPDAHLLLTLDGKLLEANQAAEKLTGLTRADMLGRNVLLPGLMPEEEVRRAATRLRERAAGAPASTDEFTILHRNGSRVFVETYSQLVTIDGGQVMLLCLRDITSRKIARQERRKQTDLIEQLQNATLALAARYPVGAGDIRQINGLATRTLCELTGASEASVWLFAGDSGEIRCLDRFDAATATHSAGEVDISSRHAARADEFTESQIIPEDSGSVLEAAIRTGNRTSGILRIGRAESDAHGWQPDPRQLVETVANLLGQSLTHADRAKADEALRKSEARLALSQRVAAIGTWERDLAAETMTWSDEVFRIYGIAENSPILTRQFFRDRVHPADLQKVDSAMAGLLLTGEPCQVTFRIALPDGSERFVREVAELETNLSGQPVRLTGTVQDITEIRNLEDRLLTAQRLDGIGRMASGIAREFGDVLAVIKGHASLIMRSATQESVIRQGMDAILGTCQSASGLIEQLLVLSERKATSPEARDVNSIVRNFDRMLRPLLGGAIELSMIFDPEPGTVETNETEIQQILLSLALNARYSMPGGGRLVIETAGIRGEREFRSAESDPGFGSWVMLAASSMPAESGTLGALINADPTGEGGAGPGLSPVYGLVQRCGGKVRVKSGSGNMNKVSVFLPQAEREENASDEDSPPEEKIRGNETILVVEDQQEIRTLARTALEGLGYTVLSAPNGDAALRINLEYREPIDLLLTDVVMPGISGGELADRLTELRPSLKVLFMSGYTTHNSVQKNDAARGRAFIRKPFDPFALAAKIRNLLGVAATPAAILVADGDPGVRGMVSRVLTTAGYRLIEASDASQTAEHLRTGGVDLLVADATIVADPAVAATIKVAGIEVITVLNTMEDALYRRSEAVLTRPIQPDALLAAVRGILLSHK